MTLCFVCEEDSGRRTPSRTSLPLAATARPSQGTSGRGSPRRRRERGRSPAGDARPGLPLLPLAAPALERHRGPAELWSLHPLNWAELGCPALGLPCGTAAGQPGGSVAAAQAGFASWGHSGALICPPARSYHKFSDNRQLVFDRSNEESKLEKENWSERSRLIC